MAKDKQTLVDAFKEAAGIQPTYTIQITDKQRTIMMCALHHYARLPDTSVSGADALEARTMSLRLANTQSWPLETDGVNSFVE